MKNKKHACVAILFFVILLSAMICVACALGSSRLKNRDIPDYITINGIQYSTSLTELVLGKDNKYLQVVHLQNEDIVPLQYMINLTSLHLGGNHISDLTPLSGLKKLTELNLRAPLLTSQTDG